MPLRGFEPRGRLAGSFVVRSRDALTTGTQSATVVRGDAFPAPADKDALDQIDYIAPPSDVCSEHSMQPSIIHRTISNRLKIDDSGVELRPLFGNPALIPWSDIEFVCLVPSMEKTPTGWHPKPNSLLPKAFRSTLDTHGLIELNIVVRDRRSVLSRIPDWWTRSWMFGQLKPMLDVSDRLREDQSLLRLKVYRKRLNGSLDALLDLLERHSRFDLVVGF